MLILTSETRLTTPSAATIGCFDGVHRGHQSLVKLLLRESGQRGLMPMVITFDRQPRQLFDPSFQPQLLSTMEEKVACLETLGIKQIVVLPFTKELATLSAEAFIRQVLWEQLGVHLLVTGYDNRFGHDRSEGFDDYVRYGPAVSSTVLRQLLTEQGRVDLMPTYLTRPYSMTGHVVSGEHIGQTLGFPTANLELDNAEKYTKTGTIRLLVDCNKKHMVRYTVEDTGIGIQQADAERIFEKFVQLNENEEGTGIGLTVARSIAQRLGGDVVLDTSYKNGARFRRFGRKDEKSNHLFIGFSGFTTDGWWYYASRMDSSQRARCAT